MSVIIPCYNCAGTLRRAVDSVARQTLVPAEVLLIDDQSTDDTWQVLTALKSEFPPNWIKVISLSQNGGAAKARNAGWDAATQTYLAFLDADDSWHAEKIAVQYGWMSSRPSVGLTGHDSLVISEGITGATASVDSIAPEQITQRRLLKSNCFSTPTIMLRRDLPHRFDPNKRRGEDFLLWLEICFAGIEVYRFHQVLAFIHKPRFGAGGLSGDLYLMQRGEIDAYRKLRIGRKLTATQYALIYCYSWMKYVRRVLTAQFRFFPVAK